MDILMADRMMERARSTARPVSVREYLTRFESWITITLSVVVVLAYIYGRAYGVQGLINTSVTMLVLRFVASWAFLVLMILTSFSEYAAFRFLVLGEGCGRRLGFSDWAKVCSFHDKVCKRCMPIRVSATHEVFAILSLAYFGELWLAFMVFAGFALKSVAKGYSYSFKERTRRYILCMLPEEDRR